MNMMSNKWLTLFLLLALSSISACSGLLKKQSVQTTYFSLSELSTNTQQNKLLTTDKTLPTLIVNTPTAAAGYDTRRMMYTRSPHQLEYFARNEWVDTPANMLQPLMISAIKNSGQFSAVIPKLGAVKTDLRLEAEVIRLVQLFEQQPSVVRFTLRVVVIDSATGKIIDSQEFDEKVMAASDNPIGGVNAANLAVDNVLKKLSIFAAESAAKARLVVK